MVEEVAAGQAVVPGGNVGVFVTISVDRFIFMDIYP